MESEFPHFLPNFQFENLENENPNKRVNNMSEEELGGSVKNQKGGGGGEVAIPSPPVVWVCVVFKSALL